MSFIPIIARADISVDGNTPTATTKKGKITPAQMAQINAWSLASKTGILNALDKCIATASIVNSSNKSTVTFKSGYIVIYGRLFECENGTTIEINTLEQKNGKIILSVDLSQLKENEVQVKIVNSSYRLKDDDLNENPLTGKYDFELYSYTTSGTTVTLTRSNTDYIPDLGGRFSQFEKSLVAEGKPLYNYDMSKGTIEERLMALGFKQGSVENLSEFIASQNKIIRSGNYCILNLELHLQESKLIYINGENQEVSFVCTLPYNFSGELLRSFSCYGVWSGTTSSSSGHSTINGVFEGVIKDNTLTLNNFYTDNAAKNLYCFASTFIIKNFGYESNPL